MDKRLVLVIDNDESIIEVISIVLEDSGLHVISVQIPSFHAFITNVPDFIIMDIGPYNRGHRDFYDQIRFNGTTAHIPVMLTSTCQGLAKVASSWNAECHLPKPFDIDHLTTLVNTHLKSVY